MTNNSHILSHSRWRLALALLSATISLFLPLRTHATAGQGGGGMGGLSMGAGGGGGSGGGLHGGAGGRGGDNPPDANTAGVAGGAGVTNRRFIEGGQPGHSGTAANGAGGGPGSSQHYLGGGGGGGSGVGAGGGGGGAGYQPLNNPAPGGRGATVLRRLSSDHVVLDIGSSIVGHAGSAGPISSLSGAGGGGTALLGKVIDVLVDDDATVSGGAGGRSASELSDSGLRSANGGGGGGAAIVAENGSVAVHGTVVGGIGGISRGYAGAGGDAVVLTKGMILITPYGRISGGAGGSASGTYGPAYSGAGGAALSLGTGTIINEGRVEGGAGGRGSTVQKSPRALGGPAIQIGYNSQVINKGTLQGGLHGTGTGTLTSKYGPAVIFEGSDNTLTLWQASITNGDLRFIGQHNVLALGSDTATINTVKLNGSLTLGPQGIYRVRIADDQADMLTLSGSANLTQGQVEAITQPDSYRLGYAYVILKTPSGSLDKTRFSSATANLAYITPTLSYSEDDKTVFLTLNRKTEAVEPAKANTPSTTPAPPLPFASLIRGANARAAANAVDALPTTHPLYHAALNLTTDAPPIFFGALSGELHADVLAGLTRLANTVSDMPLTQLRSILVPASESSLNSQSDTAFSPAHQHAPLWATLVGHWQNTGSTRDSASVRQHTGGLFVGGDAPVGAGWHLGAAVGYTDTSLTVNNWNSKADLSSYSAIVYGGKALDVGPGRLNIMAGLAYTWHDIHTQRQTTLTDAAQTLNADYGASTGQVFTELDYLLPIQGPLTMGPFIGLTWADQRTRAFNENAGPTALSGSASDIDTAASTLGLRLRQDITLGTLHAHLTAAGGWRHAFGSRRPASTLAFDAGQTFNVVSAPLAQDSALLAVGITATAGSSTVIGLDYSGQLSSHSHDQTAMLNVRWTY